MIQRFRITLLYCALLLFGTSIVTCQTPPKCSIINCGELPCCGTVNPACYSPQQYVCTGDFLCPVGAPQRCGGACYNPTVHQCVNNQLVPRTGGSPPSPSPSPPSPPPSGGPATPCTTQDCGGLPCCSGACYSPQQYVCTNGFLCPVSAPQRCGSACYSPSAFHCQNGVLLPGSDGSTPPSPPPPSSVGSCNDLGPWFDGAPSPIVHSEGGTGVIGNRMYVFSGFQGTELTCSNRLDIYDITTNSWSTGAPFPVGIGVSHMQAASWRNPPPGQVPRSIFLAGGFPGANGGAATNQVWRYDTIDNQYYALPPLPDSRASGAVAIDSNHRLHYIGGLLTDRVTNSDTHWVLNLLSSNPTWIDIGVKFPSPRNHVQAVQIGNQLFASGGQFGHEPNYAVVHTPIGHAFNLGSNSWSSIANQPTPRSHAEPATLVVNNKLVLLGGRSLNWDNLATAVEYDPVRNSWNSLRSLPAGRLSPSSGFFKDVVVNGVRGDYIVVGCGMNDPAPTNIWITRVTNTC